MFPRDGQQYSHLPHDLDSNTPSVDDIDRRVAEEVSSYAHDLNHLVTLAVQHPRFTDAAMDWMHVAEQSLREQNPDLSPRDARLEALATLESELIKDKEDPALVDVVDTIRRVTTVDIRVPYEDTHAQAA